MCYGNSVPAPFAPMRTCDDSIQDLSTDPWCRLFHNARLMERWWTHSPAPRDASVLVSLLDLVNQTKIRFHVCEGIEEGRIFFFQWLKSSSKIKLHCGGYASLVSQHPSCSQGAWEQLRQVLSGNKNRTLFWAIKCYSNLTEVHRCSNMVIILRKSV